MKIVREFVIENNAGLHARAAALLVHAMSNFVSHIEIEKDGEIVNGKSIMGVMMLAAVKGSVIKVMINGDDAESAMTAVSDLIARKFDEE